MADRSRLIPTKWIKRKRWAWEQEETYDGWHRLFMVLPTARLWHVNKTDYCEGRDAELLFVYWKNPYCKVYSSPWHTVLTHKQMQSDRRPINAAHMTWNHVISEISNNFYCASSRKVTGSIPDGVIGIFLWHAPSSRAMSLGSNKPLSEMNTKNISWRENATGA